MKPHPLYKLTGLWELRIGFGVDVANASGFGVAQSFNHDADESGFDTETFAEIFTALLGDVQEAYMASFDYSEPAECHDFTVDLTHPRFRCRPFRYGGKGDDVFPCRRTRDDLTSERILGLEHGFVGGH